MELTIFETGMHGFDGNRKSTEKNQQCPKCQKAAYAQPLYLMAEAEGDKALTDKNSGRNDRYF